MLLRAANAQDVDRLGEVHLTTWLTAYRGLCADEWLDSLDLTTFRGYHRPRFVNPPDPQRPYMVVEVEGRVEGFSIAGPIRGQSPVGDPVPDDFVSTHSAELYAIYVDPARQGQGLGVALFREAVRCLLDLGHQTMGLWVFRENHSSRRFYERMGGVAVAEAPITLGGLAYPQTGYGWRPLCPV